MSMADAALDAFMVPIGWVIGCPLLGYVSDRIGRRKPVLIAGALVTLNRRDDLNAIGRIGHRHGCMPHTC
jgi:MFS family permease